MCKKTKFGLDEEFEICFSCPIFKDEYNKLSKTSDSVFDAASDLCDFIDECQKTCPTIKKDAKNGKIICSK